MKDIIEQYRDVEASSVLEVLAGDDVFELGSSATRPARLHPGGRSTAARQGLLHRLCPELKQDGKTRAGTPVRVQLLGQHPEWLAENAIRAIELGSPGVDLNFGCPAPTVNKSKGGAVLLKEPETVYRIVKAVREAVPAHLPVSAKIRLG